MIYVYAIAEGLDTLSDLTGIHHEPISSIPHGDAQIIVGDVAARPTLDAQTLRVQDALVRALHERSRALLPMRFSTTAADRDELLRVIARQPLLTTRLAAVRGCEQMTVRVFGRPDDTQDPTQPAASGTEYLRSRAKRLQPPASLARLARSAAALARDTRLEPASQPGVRGTVYHLIARGGSERYRALIEGAAREQPDLRVVISGPSPAYAFA